MRWLRTSAERQICQETKLDPPDGKKQEDKLTDAGLSADNAFVFKQARHHVGVIWMFVLHYNSSLQN